MLVGRMAIAAATLGLASPLLAAAPASALVDPSAPEWYEVDVVGTSITSNVIRYDQELGRCGGGRALKCTVEASHSATRTIGTAFGLSVAGVAATLDISKSTTATITATCTGTPQPPTYNWVVGCAEGSSYRYTVRQRKYVYGRLTQTTNSTQYAFNPTGIHCSLTR